MTYVAGRPKVMAQPRQMVAKMSMEMKTIWLKIMPYLHIRVYFCINGSIKCR